jgi:hypothetical protein
MRVGPADHLGAACQQNPSMGLNVASAAASASGARTSQMTHGCPAEVAQTVLSPSRRPPSAVVTVQGLTVAMLPPSEQLELGQPRSQAAMPPTSVAPRPPALPSPPPEPPPPMLHQHYPPPHGYPHPQLHPHPHAYHYYPPPWPCPQQHREQYHYKQDHDQPHEFPPSYPPQHLRYPPQQSYPQQPYHDEADPSPQSDQQYEQQRQPPQQYEQQQWPQYEQEQQPREQQLREPLHQAAVLSHAKNLLEQSGGRMTHMADGAREFDTLLAGATWFPVSFDGPIPPRRRPVVEALQGGGNDDDVADDEAGASAANLRD